jgi:hypothetical protein
VEEQTRAAVHVRLALEDEGVDAGLCVMCVCVFVCHARIFFCF